MRNLLLLLSITIFFLTSNVNAQGVYTVSESFVLKNPVTPVNDIFLDVTTIKIVPRLFSKSYKILFLDEYGSVFYTIIGYTVKEFSEDKNYPSQILTTRYDGYLHLAIRPIDEYTELHLGYDRGTDDYTHLIEMF